MGVIDRNTDLGSIRLPEQIGKNQRMLLRRAIGEWTPLHDAVRNFVELEACEVIDGSPCGTAHSEAAGNQFLM